MPEYDPAAGTICSIATVREVINANGQFGGMRLTDALLLQAARSATNKIQNWTNRRWIPLEGWSYTYDAPPGSRLYLWNEEIQDDDNLLVSWYGTTLAPSTTSGYKLLRNVDGTAVEKIELHQDGKVVEWDYGHSSYKDAIEVTGTAWYGLPPPEVLQEALKLTIREWQRENEQFARSVGQPDNGWEPTTHSDYDIMMALRPWTRFIEEQSMRTGTE